MLVLSGRGGFELLGPAMADEASQKLLRSATALLERRGESLAVAMLQTTPFELCEGTNDFGDDFTVLHAAVSLTDYEDIRKEYEDGDLGLASIRVASVLTEIGPYVRFVAVSLDQDRDVSPVEERSRDFLMRLDSATVAENWRRAQGRVVGDPEFYGTLRLLRLILRDVATFMALQDFSCSGQRSASRLPHRTTWYTNSGPPTVHPSLLSFESCGTNRPAPYPSPLSRYLPRTHPLPPFTLPIVKS